MKGWSQLTNKNTDTNQKNIVLFGHGGSYNHGCEAIVRSTIGILEDKNLSIDLYTNSVSSDEEFGLDKLVKLHPQRVVFNKFSPVHVSAMVMRKFLKSDSAYLKTFFSGKMDDVKNKLCISIGGDMYCYGKLSWLYYIHSLLKSNRNKTVLWGCSVDDGSFFEESLNDLKRYDMIITRESISYELFKKHGIKNVKLYPDPAFCLKKQNAVLDCSFDGENTIAINVSPLMNRYKQGASLETNVENLIEHILKTTKLDILFVPHVNGGAVAEDDYTYLKSYADKYTDTKRVKLLGRHYNCSQLKYIISLCRFLITARTHASIAAYSTCVPTVVLGYSVKSRGIAKDIFGTEKGYVVPVQALKEPNDLANSFDWLVENEEKMKNHLQEFMPDYISKSQSAVDEIEVLL